MGEAAPELQEAPENPDNETPETLASAGATFAANARFEAAMRRIQAVTGTRTQVELAKLLDIRQSSVSDAKKRASIPDAWLVRLVKDFAANPTWVLSGEETPYLRRDTDRAAPDGAPRDEGPEEEPTPEASIGELARRLEERLGGFLQLAVVPAGARVTFDMPAAVVLPKTQTMGKTGSIFRDHAWMLKEVQEGADHTVLSQMAAWNGADGDADGKERA